MPVTRSALGRETTHVVELCSLHPCRGSTVRVDGTVTVTVTVTRHVRPMRHLAVERRRDFNAAALDTRSTHDSPTDLPAVEDPTRRFKPAANGSAIYLFLTENMQHHSVAAIDMRLGGGATERVSDAAKFARPIARYGRFRMPAICRRECGSLYFAKAWETQQQQQQQNIAVVDGTEADDGRRAVIDMHNKSAK
jgi:hypothetical protein